MENEIFYCSDKEGEKKFFENSINSNFYTLKNSSKTKIEKLPLFLDEFDSCLKNTFLTQQAGIKESDNYFTKLFLLAKLDFDRTHFFLKS